MRDYNLIRYIAKLTGAKPKRDKEFLECFFPYDKEGLIPVHILFKKKTSVLVLFDLIDIYETYAKDKSADYETFIDQFLVENGKIFEKVDINGQIELKSDLSVNWVEHVVSQALVSVTYMTARLNAFLGRKAVVLAENDWRTLHRGYLKKQKMLSGILSAVCLAAAVGGMVWAANSIGSFVFLSVVLIVGGILGCGFFLLRYFHYRRHLKKALADRKYA